MLSSIKRKERSPEIGEGDRSFLPHACGMCFTAGYSFDVVPQRCTVRLPAVVVNTSFPISSAKVLQFFDIRKFFGKKMHLYPLFRKYTNKGKT